MFAHATTPVPATLPALASLHTGVYPGRHRVRTNLVKLGNDSRLIAETLHASGYTTAAFYGNSLLEPQSGFGRGFDTYVSFVEADGRADARGTDLARAWLADSARSPWLLWVHFMDPHGRYHATPGAGSGSVDGSDPLPERELAVSPTNYGLSLIPKYQELPGVTRASEYRRRYRDEIRSTDEQIGRLLATLDELGQERATLVVITADHGESLGEHECYFQHGWFPYEEQVHVPLLVRLPGPVSVPPQVQDPVSLVDLVPTLLAGLDMPPTGEIEGRDLSALLQGSALPETPVFAVTSYLNQMTSVRRGRWKLVHTPAPPAPFQGDPWVGFYRPSERFELFDLEQDAGEMHDLHDVEQERTGKLWKDLAQWRSAHGIPIGERPAVPALDEETRKRLEALGYGW